MHEASDHMFPSRTVSLATTEFPKLGTRSVLHRAMMKFLWKRKICPVSQDVCQPISLNPSELTQLLRLSGIASSSGDAKSDQCSEASSPNSPIRTPPKTWDTDSEIKRMQIELKKNQEKLLIQDQSFRSEITALQINLKHSKEIEQQLLEQANTAQRRLTEADSNVACQKVVAQFSLLLANEEHEAEISTNKAAIDSLTTELKEKDMKCIVALLASERLQSQLDTERLELKAKAATVESELLRSICGNVAHDLKTPLHTIMMGLESLRGPKMQCNIQSRELLDTLDSAVAFMSSAIGRAIDFTKSSSGLGLTPTLSAFCLSHSLTCPVKWMNSILSADSSISINLGKIPPILATLISDKHWVEENLLCLLSNAVKYSNQGSVDIIVALEGDVVRITVEDHGIGIPAESRSQLFKQFSQVQRMTVGGSGLGLYSLSKRSEAIGGSCGVNDRSDGQQGSAFWFEFPFRADIVMECETGPVSSNASSIDSHSSLRILLVDDSISVLKMLSRKLEEHGHSVVTAKNGAEGLSKMVSMNDGIDLVIMDLQMPVMDGIEATRRYREKEITDGLIHLPIICSSAKSDGETQQSAKAAGMDLFLPKPFNMDTLSRALSEVFTNVPVLAV